MELHRRDKDLGQAGQMLPLTPRGDSADYQAGPPLPPPNTTCACKRKTVFLEVRSKPSTADLGLPPHRRDYGTSHRHSGLI